MDPKEVLSDEESQALREADDQSGVESQAATEDIRDLHADHWERIVADRVPALESISERMVSLLKTTGREFLRRSVEVTAAPAKSYRWGIFAQKLPVPTSLNVLTINPLGVKGVVCLNPAFVFALVDVFFGGDGNGERTIENPDFTPMEERLVRKFVARIAYDMREAWRPFIDLEFELGASETNPIFASVAAGSEVFSATTFRFELGDKQFELQSVLPARLVEPIRYLRDAGQAHSSQADSEKWRSRLQQDMQEASVQLRAVLTETRINLRELTSAKPGDIIPTDIPATMRMYAGDQPILEGTFGVCQGQNAVRVNKLINPRMLGEKYGRVPNAR